MSFDKYCSKFNLLSGCRVEKFIDSEFKCFIYKDSEHKVAILYLYNEATDSIRPVASYTEIVGFHSDNTFAINKDNVWFIAKIINNMFCVYDKMGFLKVKDCIKDVKEVKLLNKYGPVFLRVSDMQQLSPISNAFATCGKLWSNDDDLLIWQEIDNDTNCITAGYYNSTSKVLYHRQIATTIGLGNGMLTSFESTFMYKYPKFDRFGNKEDYYLVATKDRLFNFAADIATFETQNEVINNKTVRRITCKTEPNRYNSMWLNGTMIVVPGNSLIFTDIEIGGT